jgi:hypothetical protein
MLDSLSDAQVSLLLTGDCWELHDDCLCRSFDRFELYRLGHVDVHGRFTTLGFAMRAALIDD